MSGAVYLLGSERSGTNFLRKSIGERQTTVCCTIPPAHFLRTFGYWSHAMGDFRDDATWAMAIGYLIRSTRERAVPWDIALDPEEIRNAYAKRFGEVRDLVRLNDVLYTAYAEAKGFTTYLCKDLWLHDFVPEVAEALPQARFLHLVRDPRDVCASQKRRPFGEQDVWKLSRDWKTQCDAALRQASWHGLHARFLRVSYEDLTARHEQTMAEILAFLDLKREATADGGRIPTHFHEWKNLSKPVMRDNSGAFVDVLSTSEIAIVEAVTWHTMRLLGYRPTARTRPVTGLWGRQAYPLLARLRTSLRRRVNRWRLRNEPIDRKASAALVAELEQRFR